MNLAVALNSDCTNCQTLAAAYQTVTQNDTRVQITGAGRQEIAQLRQDLNTLRTRDLTIEQIAAEADRIAGEFSTVLETEVVSIGPADRPSGVTASQTPSGTGSGQPGTSPSTGSSTPSGSASTGEPSTTTEPATPTSAPSSTTDAGTSAPAGTPSPSR